MMPVIEWMMRRQIRYNKAMSSKPGKTIRVELPYGESRITAELPAANTRYILQAADVPGCPDEAEAILAALRRPIGCPALKNRINADDKILVITTDNTRHCPDDRILPALLEELEAKVPRQNITIMIALGLHAPLDKAQLNKKLGRKIVENYRVLNHDPADTVRLGVTSFGTPVEVNRAAAEADFRISTGFVEPHFFAGFSGGRKSIAPGVSSAAAIRHNHRFEMISHPDARAGVLKGNPIHEDMVEQARTAKLDFIVNVLLNAEKRITHVFAGDPWEAHARACEMEGKIAGVELDRKADITVVTNGGSPLDLDFYQTCKGIDTAAGITRDGGAIIAVSSCFQGPGPDFFIAAHTCARTPSEVLQRLGEKDNTVLGWQNQILARAQLNHDVYLYSDMDAAIAHQMMVTPIGSIEEGVAKALEKLGKNAAIAVIPEGPLVLPRVKKK
jgi:nickel-dependent lactate racemase